MSEMRPRQALSREQWTAMAHDGAPPLVALWADTREVYALLRHDDAPLLVSTEVVDGGYPALSPARPGAAWFERMVRDLWGHTAIDGIDLRPWLDHGRWQRSAPLSLRPGPPAPAEPPEFAFGEELDQLPIGPVRGGIEPAAHLRLGLCGETVERLETRLGYTHKGTLALIRGKSPRAAARFAARLAGEATVAHSIAFARATEAAAGCEVPARALALRNLMGAVERITAHLDVLAPVAEAAESRADATLCAQRAEAMHRAAGVAFGHRLMMDCVVPGGVAADIATDGDAVLERALADLAEDLPALQAAFDPFDARIRHRLPAIREAVRRARDLLVTLPDGAVSLPVPPESGEGLGAADAPEGEIWHWLRLDHGQIASAFLCDPAWTNWPRMEAALAGCQVEDVPWLIASFGLSSSGADL
jgi:Ni,Fe-hydrogenase III large subunit